MEIFAHALAVNAGLALAAWRWRLLTASGALAAGGVGLGVMAAWGWKGFLPLLVFFLLGTGSSFLGHSASDPPLCPPPLTPPPLAGEEQSGGDDPRGREGGVDPPEGSTSPHPFLRFAQDRLLQRRGKWGIPSTGSTCHPPRSWRNVLANGGVALGCSAAAWAWPQASPLWLSGFLGSLAAAAADTVSGELGMVWGRKTVWITTFRPAPRGANGAVSPEGTAWGGLAGFLVALTAWGAGLVQTPWEMFLLTGAGMAGMIADSYLGALLENRGWIGNEGVNIGCTLTGAAAAVWLL